MNDDLTQHPLYLFAIAFLSRIDGIVVPSIPEDAQFLGILQKLPGYPKRAWKATLADTIKEIVAHTENWSVEKIAEADAVLRESGTLSLSEIQNKYKRRR